MLQPGNGAFPRFLNHSLQVGKAEGSAANLILGFDIIVFGIQEAVW